MARMQIGLSARHTGRYIFTSPRMNVPPLINLSSSGWSHLLAFVISTINKLHSRLPSGSVYLTRSEIELRNTVLSFGMLLHWKANSALKGMQQFNKHLFPSNFYLIRQTASLDQTPAPRSGNIWHDQDCLKVIF